MFSIQRITTISIIVLLVSSIGSVAQGAWPDDPTEQAYVDAYHKAIDCTSQSAVGRNIQRDGYGPNYREPTHEELVESIGTLENLCAPPPEPVTSTTSTTSTTPAPATTTSTGGCPASMAGEASSPDAVNPTSGASGCYQVIPSTAAAMGPACADVNAASCVAAICAEQGNGAWSASGAAPC